MLLRKKSMLIIVVGIALILVLSACKMVVHTQFNEDGSGEFSISFVISNDDIRAVMELYEADESINDDELLDYVVESAGFESIGDLCESLLEEMGEDFPDVSSKANETSEGLECKINMSFDTIEEYKQLQDNDELELSLDENGNFTYRMAASDADLDMGEFSYYQDMLGIDFVVLWSITVPGEITSHNGTSVSGNTVTWDLLEVAQGGDFTLEVLSEKPEPTPTPKPQPTADTASESGGDVSDGGGGNDGSGGGMDTTTILIIALVVVVTLFLASQKKKSGEEM